MPVGGISTAHGPIPANIVGWENDDLNGNYVYVGRDQYGIALEVYGRYYLTYFEDADAHDQLFFGQAFPLEEIYRPHLPTNSESRTSATLTISGSANPSDYYVVEFNQDHFEDGLIFIDRIMRTKTLLSATGFRSGSKRIAHPSLAQDNDRPQHRWSTGRSIYSG